MDNFTYDLMNDCILYCPHISGGAGGKVVGGPGGQGAKGGGANDVFLVTSAEGKIQLIQVRNK